MRGNDKVIQFLNEVLKAELTAINQYFLHAKMCDNWGYKRLAHHSREESIDEMKHAEWCVERILFLEGTPNMSELFPLKIGSDVKKQHEADLALEEAAVARLNNAIRTAVKEGDSASRELFEKILIEEEHHIDWLEAQLGMIKEIGIENYLAQHIHKED